MVILLRLLFNKLKVSAKNDFKGGTIAASYKARAVEQATSSSSPSTDQRSNISGIGFC